MNSNLSRAGIIFALVALLATLFLDRSLSGISNGAEAPVVPVETLPLELADWKGRDLAEMGERTRGILKLDHYIKRLYSNSKGQQIFVYVGYWKKQSGEHQAAKHSPVTCLPSNGWKIFDPKKTFVENVNLNVNRLVGTFNSRSSVFYYWFFSGNETYLEEWKALIKIGLGNLLHGRSDGGIVEISTVMDKADGTLIKPEEVDKVLNDFMLHFYPPLKEMISSAKTPE